MAKEDLSDLKKFLKPFDGVIQKKVFWLRNFVWELYPKANELIYDNYNALAFGWSPTEKMGHVFCSIAVGRTSYNIHFGFLWGASLSDPKKILMGEGNQYRYILVKEISDFPVAYMKRLIREAYDNSMVKVKDKKLLEGGGKTITKSISRIKRTKGGKVRGKR